MDNFGSRQNGMGRNRKPGGDRLGPSGNCVCVKCNYSVPKQRGLPCTDEKCPHCGAVLLREGGAHHTKAVKNIKRR